MDFNKHKKNNRPTKYPARELQRGLEILRVPMASLGSERKSRVAISRKTSMERRKRK